MPATDLSADYVAGVISGFETTLLDSTHGRLGIGDDNTAFNSNQTQLQAIVNAGDYLIKSLYSGSPNRDPANDGSDHKVSYTILVTTNEGNFDWNEWSLQNSAGLMLIREVEYIGTKTDASQWMFEVTIAFNLT